MKETILIIDDNEDMRKLLSDVLKTESYKVRTAENGKKGIEELTTNSPEIVLLDVKLPDIHGIEVLKEIKKADNNIIVIMMTAYGGIQDAVNAMKLGAFDYVTKPFSNDEIIVDISKALQNRSLKMEVDILKKKLEIKEKGQLFIGESPQIQQILNDVKTISPTNLTVLIQGESGTGKELIARMIHQTSLRQGFPFITIDSGTLQETLVESELFGYEKGAFTGAVTSKEGKFELANKGTIFLDEITNLSYLLQSKLLRIVQERKARRLGGEKERNIDVRIITATNKILSEQVETGEFREDLFYRLNEYNITIPPLRERKEDIPLLVKHFIEAANIEFNKNVEGASGKVMKSLFDYPFYGNVRELKNIIRNATLLADSNYIEKIDLTENQKSNLEKVDFLSDIDKGISFKEITQKATEKIEKEIIEKVLIKTKNNKTLAAKLLKIDRMTLYTRIKSFGL